MIQPSSDGFDAERDAKIAVVRALLERVIGRGERQLIPELCEQEDAMMRGMEKVQMMRVSFPDLALAIERYEVHGDFVIAYFKGHGTHLGELMGRPPTGKRVVFDGSNVYRVVNGKIREGWGHLNVQDALRDLFK